MILTVVLAIVFCAWELDNVLAKLFPPFKAPVTSLITLVIVANLDAKRFLREDAGCTVIAMLEGLSPGNSEAMVFCKVVVSNPSASLEA